MIAQDLNEVFKKYPTFEVVFTSRGNESIHVGRENIGVVLTSEQIYVDVGDFKEED